MKNPWYLKRSACEIQVRKIHILLNFELDGNMWTEGPIYISIMIWNTYS